jgi:hypothetical protein
LIKNVFHAAEEKIDKFEAEREFQGPCRGVNDKKDGALLMRITLAWL